MGNVLRILKRDIVRLLKSPAALVVVIALLVLPSVYTWYNVVAFWDPYVNTGNLKVCVVNQDAGASSDATGDLNVGERIVEELRSNDQLDWTEEDYDAALEDLKAGRLYAVYVIPQDFSECLISPLSGEVKHPKLEYYANEKISPVSPKITDAAANALDQTINSMFVTTVSDMAVKVVDEAIEDAKTDIADSKSKASKRFDDARKAISQVQDALSDLEATTKEAKDKVSTVSEAVGNAAPVIDDAAAVLQDVSSEASAVQKDLTGVSAKVSSALPDVLARITKATSKANTTVEDFSAMTAATQDDINDALKRVTPLIDATTNASQDMQAIADSLPDTGTPAKDLSSSKYSLTPGTVWTGDGRAKKWLANAAEGMASCSKSLQSFVNNTSSVVGRVDSAAQIAAEATSTLDSTANKASTTLQLRSNSFFKTTVPAIDAGLAELSATCSDLSGAIAAQKSTIRHVQASLRQLSGVLSNCENAVSKTSNLIKGLQDDIDAITTDAALLGQSGVIEDVVKNGTLNAQSISDFMGAPTELRSVQFYHPNAYGAAMAPLFMNLTFWIGAFMLVIILRVEADSEGIRRITLAQRYVARFGMFSVFAIFQALICCAGVLALGVQAANVPALFFAAAIASLAYLSIIFALSSSLRHIGKGLCIVLVFAQIPGGSGLYPVELTSSFFQAIYPFLPFSYGIDAMREAIGGFYGDYYTHDLLVLAAFYFGALALGLILKPLIANVTHMVARQARESDLLNGGDVAAPSRPYRFSQVVHALSDSADYRQELERRYTRFRKYYPIFLRASIVLGVGVPVVLASMMALNTAEKVVLLTVFLLWLICLFVFLVVVESLRYSFERQLNMGHMTEERLSLFYANRERMVSTAEREMPSRPFSARIAHAKHGREDAAVAGEPSELDDKLGPGENKEPADKAPAHDAATQVKVLDEADENPKEDAKPAGKAPAHGQPSHAKVLDESPKEADDA